MYGRGILLVLLMSAASDPLTLFGAQADANQNTKKPCHDRDCCISHTQLPVQCSSAALMHDACQITKVKTCCACLGR
jgi:hypothetical protein